MDLVVPLACGDTTCFPETECTLAQVCDNGECTYLDVSAELVWQSTPPSSMEWQESMDYCADLSWGGYDDWALPNIDELRTLLQILDHSTQLPQQLEPAS